MTPTLFASQERLLIQQSRKNPNKPVRVYPGLYYIYVNNTLYEIKRFDQYSWTWCQYGFNGNDLFRTYSEAKSSLLNFSK